MRNIIICKQAIRHWVLTYTTALRRFLGWRIMKPHFGGFWGCRIMKPHFGGFTSVPPQKNDNFMAKMEKYCFLFAKNDYLIRITSIFSLK